MLINSLFTLLLSNSITLRRDKSILYSMTTITILLISSFITYDNLYFVFLNKGIGIYAGLFHSTSTTSVFHIFILLVTSVILTLTAFYPTKVRLDEWHFPDLKRVYYYKAESDVRINCNCTGWSKQKIDLQIQGYSKAFVTWDSPNSWDLPTKDFFQHLRRTNFPETALQTDMQLALKLSEQHKISLQNEVQKSNNQGLISDNQRFKLIKHTEDLYFEGEQTLIKACGYKSQNCIIDKFLDSLDENICLLLINDVTIIRVLHLLILIYRGYSYNFLSFYYNFLSLYYNMLWFYSNKKNFFTSKKIIFSYIISLFIFIPFIAILTSVISAVYYLAIIKQIFFDKPAFEKNPMFDSIYADGLLTEKNEIIKEVYIYSNNILISSSLSLPVSIITFIISLFIFIPQEWLSLANLLVLIILNV